MKTLSLLMIIFCAQVLRANDGVEFFKVKVRPIFAEHCTECHGEKKQKGGLRLDSRAAWQRGGDSGDVIVPGKPEESLLLKAVGYADKDLAMPPKDKGGKLADAEIAALAEWVRRGAVYPRDEVRKIGGMTEAEARGWWSFQPVKAVPGASVDSLIGEKLAAAGLPAAPLADTRTLIRRMAYDLTGLPPTAEEVHDFVQAASVDRQAASSALIERLLVSPHYGERWGRHWLDVVRYTDSLDSRSYGNDGDLVDAWRYRDWVVGALNRDLPYDQFITQQIAGDILAAQAWEPQLVVATGMYAIGNWGNGDADKEKVYTDIVDDQIDVTCRAFLGLTMACARCHDHKFDALTTRDYYGLSGIFFSSHILPKFQSKGEGEKLARWPLLSPEQATERSRGQKRLVEIEAQLAGGLEPMTLVKRDIFNKPGLHAWNVKDADNPSLVINTTDVEQSFITIKLPAKSIALHPGPKTAASAAWRSPVTGKVRVSAQVRDADATCGDGIAWEVRHAGKKLGAGEMNNGGSADFPEREIAVKAGELVQLLIRPRAEYTCDSTVVEFLVRGEDGTQWDLRDALVHGAEQGQDGVWWVCSGEGGQLGGELTGRAALEAEKSALTAAMARAEFAQGLQEGGIPATGYEGFHDAKIHTRGRYDRLADLVPRSMPALLTKEQPSIAAGSSGRLELARWVARAENPLTARVIVNRIWQHHFGEGLVRTENNFGKLGTPPTHPELLDWLADEFVRSGWSVKAVHRLILSSEAYQRAAAGNAKDPENLLLAHQNRRRLSAEELRDAMLAASGTLDVTLGGKAVRELTSTRRTLYVATVRSDRATFQTLFDGADPTAIVEQRTDSVVAPQALWLMNHPFALAQAKALAAHVAAQPGDREAKLGWLCAQLFQRAPSEAEQRIAERAVTDAAGWEALCQVFLCSNEFCYLD